MRPQWFSTAAEGDAQDNLPPIPYEQMWADDVFWIPMLLSKTPFIGRADFTAGNNMKRWWFAKTKSPPTMEEKASACI